MAFIPIILETIKSIVLSIWPIFHFLAFYYPRLLPLFIVTACCFLVVIFIWFYLQLYFQLFNYFLPSILPFFLLIYCLFHLFKKKVIMVASYFIVFAGSNSFTNLYHLDSYFFHFKPYFLLIFMVFTTQFLALFMFIFIVIHSFWRKLFKLRFDF